MGKQGIWRGHKNYIVAMIVANKLLWSADSDGRLIAWNGNGEKQCEIEVYRKQPILQVVLHGRLLYCISDCSGNPLICVAVSHVRPGVMVSVNPSTFQVVQTFNNHSKSNIDSVASVQDHLWSTSCGNTIIYHKNEIVRTLQTKSWIRVLLGVQNTCWVFTDEGPVEVWAKDGSQMLQTITGTPHPLCACVCAGKVWCGNRNGELEVFSISGDRLIFEQQAHRNSIWDFAKVGRTVFSGSCDGLVRAWTISKLGKLKLVKTIPNMCSIVYCVKLFDGKLCGSGRDHHNVIVTHDAMMDWERRRILWLGWKSPESIVSKLPRSLLLRIIHILDKFELQNVSIEKVL